jgi:putative tricarboxylic transport membrane protein
MDRRIDIAVAAAFALLGLFMIWQASLIREGMMRDPIGPRAAFYACGAVLVIGGAVVILGHLRRWSQQAHHLVRNEGTADEMDFPSSALRAWGLIALVTIFAVLFQPLGFLIATPVFIVAALAVMGKRNWGVMAVIAVIFTAVTYGIFAQILSVRIPVGPLTPLFRELGWIVL